PYLEGNYFTQVSYFLRDQIVIPLLSLKGMDEIFMDPTLLRKEIRPFKVLTLRRNFVIHIECIHILEKPILYF
ncbi:MAG: hypothetical protein ACUVQ9_06115, partial [Thermodesulfobacteriota bacterium]